ncbi:unnamed protein product [Staurois parvus]|uniref:peptidyl-tRNA hydrolase n=1 Tax=Staurois parvus TaxID=386267 RepID=A0ABN9B9I0_9NEOB|nr:unnamed protein product [Staurois parvus]
MNLSGEALRYYIQKENINIQNVVVIVDDLNIPFGKIKLRTSGSHGGHNGLKNIEECLSSKEYPRLRCGIGNNSKKANK